MYFFIILTLTFIIVLATGSSISWRFFAKLFVSLLIFLVNSKIIPLIFDYIVVIVSSLISLLLISLLWKANKYQNLAVFGGSVIFIIIELIIHILYSIAIKG
jgi:hypothetical protein